MKNLLTLIFLVLVGLFFSATQIPGQQRTVSGRLSPTVESGGWLIVDQSEKFLLINAAKFSSENWFKTGAEVRATGVIKPDAVTIYQEGVPFEALTMNAVQNASERINQTTGRRSTIVTVSGSARVLTQPDTATVSVSVVTQNKNAAEAQKQNAALTAAVINALKRTAGKDAEIKTSGYSLIPQRIYKENQPPTITGYEVRNSISVTLRDLTEIGSVIDAATQAGANNIDGIAFSLRNDQKAQNQALAEATREALDKAASLAQSLGGQVVGIVAIEEADATPRPVLYARQEALASATAETPIEVGTLEINSRVKFVAEIEIPAKPK